MTQNPAQNPGVWVDFVVDPYGVGTEGPDRYTSFAQYLSQATLEISLWGRTTSGTNPPYAATYRFFRPRDGGFPVVSVNSSAKKGCDVPGVVTLIHAISGWFSAVRICVCYAMSGTAIVRCAVFLRACYEMPVATPARRKARRKATFCTCGQVKSATCLRAWYPMSGTDIAYGATILPTASAKSGTDLAYVATSLLY
eukprot:1163169-Rhodomonas_salina.5